MPTAALDGSGRYIPTLVGRLHAQTQRYLTQPVHPHACGEIDSSALTMFTLNGTSPRLWGDSPIIGVKARLGRYIPTLVGRFGRSQDKRLLDAVHPHACGEILLSSVLRPV